MFDVGDEARDFTLQAVDEGPVSLSEIVERGYDVLLVFLRHLG